ncbi:competence protein CoiA family protein [Mesorhizobium sp. 128a]
MYFAIDLATRQELAASAAQRYRRYACPVCGARVGLRQGSYRYAHFAHVSGAARPECNLYHPSSGWQGPAPESIVQLRPLPPISHAPLSLSLHVQPPAGKKPAFWGLEVQIPRAPTPKGMLTFDGGGDGFRLQVACARLHAGAQTYVVNPDSSTFRVAWVSPDVDIAYADAVRERIPGLDAEQTTVFSAGRGSHQPIEAALDWGATYYFVQRADLATRVPPQLAVTRLANLRQWSCLLVMLPQVADEPLAKWIRQATGLKVQPAKRRWGIVTPAMHFVDTSARVVLDTRSEITLAMHAGDGQDEAILTARASDSDASVQLTRGEWQFVKVCGFSAALPPVLDVDRRLLPELIARPVARTARAAILTFATRSISATSAEAGLLLDQVRRGLLSLIGLQVPRGLAPQIRSRPADSIDWDVHAVATTPAETDSLNDTVTSDALATLHAVLRDAECDVHVDLGPFGGWWFTGRAAIVTRQLPPATHAHARWVLAGAGVPLRYRSDEELSAALRALNAPRWLESHRRLALARIARGNGGSR